MHAFWKLAIYQTKLYLREPMNVFFTLLFGPVLLLLIGFIFGNGPQALFGGYGQMDISTSSIAAIVIGIVAFTAVPISVSTRRDMGVLRRFSATPLKPLTYFFADVLVPFVLTLVGVLLTLLVGKLAFNVQMYGNWLNLIIGIILSILAFFAMGFAMAGILPNARTTIIVGNVIIIPMNFFSGAFVPFEVMPAAVVKVSRFIPLTHVVTLFRGLWFGDGFGDHLLEVAVLIGILLVGIVIIALTFRWE